MPTEYRRHSATAAVLSLLAVLLLTACATTPPDPALLRPAEDALALAEQAGAVEHAPLELEEAREYYEQAVAALEAEELAAVTRHVEMTEVQARLAIVRSRGARARELLAERRAEYDSLRAELVDIYGERIQPEDTP
ncbi:DUF4398 domain-containing protein [Wenzhouxiangella sp. XN79A]|uniref:DUF4398 domain-containing protein n=1 Tax=Wenzhouxiangella sp. XN79A TaxID=2724193 RepID=UPI00144A774B|nr:DUF4398 domain-containing protein [Wenzhouxiangella sp. XN79A]NKI35692.1 DUF4398 domain-containing protein [Wenzhouxiangella sp. XN79A]